MSDPNTPIISGQAPELHLDTGSVDGLITPKVTAELGDAFAEPPKPTTPDVNELRGIFEADQEEAAKADNNEPVPVEITTGTAETVEKPRFGSAKPERKPMINMLDTKTRLGRFVSMVVFGERAPKPKTNYNPARELKRRSWVAEKAGGPISRSALNKLRKD